MSASKTRKVTERPRGGGKSAEMIRDLTEKLNVSEGTLRFWMALTKILQGKCNRLKADLDATKAELNGTKAALEQAVWDGRATLDELERMRARAFHINNESSGLQGEIAKLKDQLDSRWDVRGWLRSRHWFLLVFGLLAAFAAVMLPIAFPKPGSTTEHTAVVASFITCLPTGVLFIAYFFTHHKST